MPIFVWILANTIVDVHAVVPFPLEQLEQRLESTLTMRSKRQSSNAPTIPTNAYQLASRGQVATGLTSLNGQQATGWGVGVFDIGIQELYAALNEEESHVELSPVDYTKIVQGEPCSNNRLVMMHLPIPLLSDRWWVTKQGISPNLRNVSKGEMAELTWVAISDKSHLTLDETSTQYTKDAVWVTQSEGAWLLIQLDDQHTLGEYHAWSDPGGYIPTNVASSLSAGGIKETFDAMEQFAKSTTERKRCVFDWP